MLGIKIPARIINAIAREAGGFPYYVHQVGFHTAAAFAEDGSSQLVTDRHYETGKKRALESAFSHYLRRYKFTMYKLSELEQALLAELAWSRKRRPTIEEIGVPAMMRVQVDRQAVREALRELRSKGYVEIKKGEKAVALKDALLGPFLRARLRLKPGVKSRTSRKHDIEAPELDLRMPPHQED
jgi:hypothetical protein